MGVSQLGEPIIGPWVKRNSEEAVASLGDHDFAKRLYVGFFFKVGPLGVFPLVSF